MALQIPATHATYGNYLVLQPGPHIATRTTGVLWASGTARTLANIYANPGTNLESELRLILGLAECYTVLVGDLIDTTSGAANSGFGNSAQQTTLEAMRSVLVSTYGCSTDVVGVGMSQGHAAVCSYAIANPTKMRGVVGLIPGIDLENIRTDNYLSVRTYIDTAFGVTYPAALPGSALSSADGNLLACPWRGWAGDADPAVRVADARTFASLAPDNWLTVVADGGHDDTTLDSVDIDDLRSWIAGLSSVA